MLLSDNITFVALLISEFVCITSSVVVHKKISKSQLKTAFLALSIAMSICCTGLLIQNIFSKPLSIDPIYFDYFVYIGNCLLPLSFFFTSLVFDKTKIKFNSKYLWLFVIPIVCLLFLWTNDYHHLFYADYSIDLSTNVYGPIFIIFDVYTVVLFLIGFFLFLRRAISSSGVFSSQGILMILACAVPLVQNVLSITKIISTTIYITPICFSITLLFMFIAIFKFNFLKVSPIAIQKIVNRMSDSYIIINEHDVITDFNETFLKTFNFSASDIININCSEVFNTIGIISDKLTSTLLEARNSAETFVIEKHSKKFNKYFNIEISSITDRGNFLGILILFKDTTEHVLDMQTIQDNQDMLMEKERLASLGQMVGGIAHNLKTPIMSISGASEGLTQLTDELDASIGNPVVTNEDYHEIVRDMKEWIDKIKTHTSYMSDVITVVKGQTVAFADDQVFTFNVDTLFKQIDILMKHELKSALVTLRVSNTVPDNCNIKGNINSLVQVLNNIISNAIQAYNGKTDEFIDLSANLRDNATIEIVVRDYGPGLPEVVQKNLFKQMITTKGKSGTGLGMFMSYSNIKAHFKGNMSFETEKNKGTAFIITIPIENNEVL